MIEPIRFSFWVRYRILKKKNLKNTINSYIGVAFVGFEHHHLAMQIPE